jgi:Tol biopolymer transport system component
MKLEEFLMIDARRFEIAISFDSMYEIIQTRGLGTGTLFKKGRGIMKRGLFLIFLVILLFTSGCAQRILFERGNGVTEAQIYRMRITGEAETNISNNLFVDSSPNVCPDGKTIVFSSSRDVSGSTRVTDVYRSSKDIYIMDVNGRNVRQLTSGRGRARNPKCSPQGLVAFAAPVHGFDRIWTVKTDGTGLREVTNPGANEKDVECDFYDDGRRIVFVRADEPTGRGELYSTYFDGSQPVYRITNTPDISENFPVVSHDGRLLAYVACSPETGRTTIRLINVGSWTPINEIVMQPPAVKVIRGLGFSCDDKRLYVAVESSDVAGTYQPNRFELFSIRTDGGDQERITENGVGDYWPSAICNR